VNGIGKNTELLEKVPKIYYAARITGKKIAALPEETIDYFSKMRESTTTRIAGGLDFTAKGGKRQGRQVP
jgi:hypothetical protein